MKNNLLIFIFLQCEIYPLSLTEKKTYLPVEFTLLSYENPPSNSSSNGMKNILYISATHGMLFHHTNLA